MSTAFSPRAMTLARNAQSLTQSQLAGKLGVTQPALSQWEKGLRVPDPESVERLAQALEILPSMLCLEDTELSTPMFRAASVRSRTAEKRVEGRLEHARIAASRILDEIEIEPELRWPTDDDPIPNTPEEAAAAVRRVWRMGTGPINNLATFVEAAGAVVLRTDFGDPKVDAAYAHPRRTARRWLMLNVSTTDGARVNLSLAHELGHAMLHHWDAFDVPDDKGREAEAFRFAIALLVPQQEFIRDVSSRPMSWRMFLGLRTKWRVSAAALARYAHTLGLVSKDQYSRMMRERTKFGQRLQEPGVVDIAGPSLLGDVISLLRTQRGDSDSDFERLTGLPIYALADLFPDHFRAAPPQGPRLRIV